MTASNKPDTYPDNCITERKTPQGYWWRYQHPRDQPKIEIETAICVAFQLADAKARQSGKTYLVASTLAWPSRFCRVSSRIPASHIRVACVWRSACGVTQGARKPARSHARANRRTKAA